MEKKFCIVIPVYNKVPEITEKFSLRRLYDVLSEKNYDIYLLHGKSFDPTNYLKIFKKQKLFNSKKFIKGSKTFDDKYFTSTKSYSRLLIDYEFYNSFSEYDYMLIYQTDCYLFQDNIKDWCKIGYDYIGAPIIAQNPDWTKAFKGKPQVGNGGFSLRKISKFKEITDPNGEFMTFYKLSKDDLDKIKFEDVWFCDYVYDRYDMKIPGWIEASCFALDMNVRQWYNDIKITYLPMGCHAWPKNIRDWKDKFDNMTQDIIDYCEEKYKDYFTVYYA